MILSPISPSRAAGPRHPPRGPPAAHGMRTAKRCRVRSRFSPSASARSRTPGLPPRRGGTARSCGWPGYGRSWTPSSLALARTPRAKAGAWRRPAACGTSSWRSAGASRSGPRDCGPRRSGWSGPGALPRTSAASGTRWAEPTPPCGPRQPRPTRNSAMGWTASTRRAVRSVACAFGSRSWSARGWPRGASGTTGCKCCPSASSAAARGCTRGSSRPATLGPSRWRSAGPSRRRGAPSRPSRTRPASAPRKSSTTPPPRGPRCAGWRRSTQAFRRRSRRSCCGAGTQRPSSRSGSGGGTRLPRQPGRSSSAARSWRRRRPRGCGSCGSGRSCSSGSWRRSSGSARS
mmetsp:Transcript_12628/g.35466  ORF Transcript_12628/g.35466 Transcript_12628/m.35466 type:complete len:346 (-) Transcript_12628:41-1078(-)